VPGTRPVEQRSLFGEILDWMLAPLLLIWPMSLALTWIVAQGIANRPYDRELGTMARSLAQEVLNEYRAGRDPRPEALRARVERSALTLLRTSEEDKLYFQVLGPRGELVAGEATLPVLPPEMAAEMERDDQVSFRDELLREEPVRVAAVRLPMGAFGPPGSRTEGGWAVVQMAETLEKRSQLATDIVKGVILPQFAILPLAVLLVWLALSRGISPLARLQRRIRRREASDLSPIPVSDVPEEVAPLVAAINDLLHRLSGSMATQRHFLADAAHQLKTPLAGLRMQAELAARQIDRGQGDPASMRHSLAQIATSSQRAAHMVNQLLAMARAEDQGRTLQRAPVELAELALETVRDFVPRALERRVDLGYDGLPADGTTRFLGYPVLVRELIRNLVDNALQYTPAGGTATVRVTFDPSGPAAVLQVEDSGPGIAPGEREQVFRPFYRALGTSVDGSGLGLAIVAEIAAKHGAPVLLEDAQPRGSGAPPGARFTVRFPMAPAAQALNDPLTPAN
jgi:two-component system sensor histidine kinase TctE